MAVHVMSWQVANRRRTATAIRAAHPGALVIDVSPKGTGLWTRLSPYYPHGGIPVPLSPGAVGQSVEGVWQALKVFARDDVDRRKLLVTEAKGLKRTVRRNGAVLGYRAGLDADTLLDHEQARRRIYLPAYRWTLENAAADLIAKLAQLGTRPGHYSAGRQHQLRRHRHTVHRCRTRRSCGCSWRTPGPTRPPRSSRGPAAGGPAGGVRQRAARPRRTPAPVTDAP